MAFPPSHPVWSYPPGERARRVRELVDLALGLRGELEALKGELEVVKEKLGRVETMLVQVLEHGPAEQAPKPGLPAIDPNDFMEL